MTYLDKTLVSALLLMPSVALAHNPAKAALIIGGIYLIPGIVSVVIAKQKRPLWLLVSILLAFFSVWLTITYSINFFVGIAIPLALVPVVVWQNDKSMNKKAWLK